MERMYWNSLLLWCFAFILVAAVFDATFTRVAHAATTTTHCTVADVVVFSNRIHVRCTTSTTDGTSTVRFFAVSISDATLANRFMTLSTTALVSGRKFIANFTSGDTSGTSFGCAANDCRKVTSFGIE